MGVATYAAAMALASVAAAQDAPGGGAPGGAPGGGGIVLLIGGTPAAAGGERGAVLRLGPEDSVWTDGEEILLPVTRPGGARGRGAGGWVNANAGTDDATCLTQAVYYESRGEPLAGQQAVAQVVLNRRGRYAADVCGVVFQRSRWTCQFSFACDGAMNRRINPAAWEQARAVASRALGGFVYAPMKDAQHFHAWYVNPQWAQQIPRIQQIGQHIFYR